MLVIIIPLIICIAGLLMYVLAANPKVQQLGLHMFWVGLLVALFQGGDVKVVR